ncbi:hypothetical protein [Desulforhopalus sp. 52FAK]
MSLETYVVRIYRRDGDNVEQVVGVAESVETGETWKFVSLQELVSIFENKNCKENVKGSGIPETDRQEMKKEM